MFFEFDRSSSPTCLGLVEVPVVESMERCNTRERKRNRSQSEKTQGHFSSDCQIPGNESNPSLSLISGKNVLKSGWALNGELQYYPHTLIITKGLGGLLMEKCILPA